MTNATPLICPTSAHRNLVECVERSIVRSKEMKEEHVDMKISQLLPVLLCMGSDGVCIMPVVPAMLLVGPG